MRTKFNLVSSFWDSISFLCCVGLCNSSCTCLCSSLRGLCVRMHMLSQHFFYQTYGSNGCTYPSHNEMHLYVHNSLCLALVVLRDFSTPIYSHSYFHNFYFSSICRLWVWLMIHLFFHLTFDSSFKSFNLNQSYLSFIYHSWNFPPT